VWTPTERRGDPVLLRSGQRRRFHLGGDEHHHRSDCGGGNGNAIAVSQLATAPVVNGETFTEAYGELGAQVGQDVASAQTDQTQGQDLVTQAQQQRSQVSGVSLDAEAATLLQFQQAYNAVGKLVTVLDDLTETLMDMMPPAT
jgi:flagellar hook-associated protein 1